MHHLHFSTLAAISSLIFSSLSFVVLILIYWRVMSTTPVTQATFDAALAQFSAAFQTLLNSVQSVETGLTAVEAALQAANQNSAVDLSGELTQVQNLIAEASAAQSTASSAIASLPAADQPAPVDESANVAHGTESK